MKEKEYKELPIGGLIIEAGNAVEYKTGSWASVIPEWDGSKCTNCFICWINCPDGSIETKNDKMTGIDYDHCKGCGICATVCPVKCISMKQKS